MTLTSIVFDAEANGFLEVANTVWCIAAMEQDSTDVKLWEPAQIQQALANLHNYDVLIGHNIKKYDLPLFKKLYDWSPKSHQVVIDTLTFSRTLYPKRPNPNGYYGNAPHSIEAWAYRVGMQKPDHKDWSQYSEAMGDRCKWDVRINAAVLKELEREAGNLSDYYERLRHSECA